jgi:hypothetical protein
MTNSVVPMAKALIASASKGIGMKRGLHGVAWSRLSRYG